MNRHTTYLLAPHVLAQFDLDETVLLDEALGRYFAANPVASLILRACRNGARRDELLADVVATHRVEADRAGADLDRFLADLVARGLLRTSVAT